MEIISRKEAKEKGLKRYFTGKPCKHGHIAERGVTTGCLKCHEIKKNSDSYKKFKLEHGREYYHKHKNKIDEYQRDRREKRKIPKNMNPRFARSNAKALGQKTYFNGKECPNGIAAHRLTSTGSCLCHICTEKKNKRNSKNERNSPASTIRASVYRLERCVGKGTLRQDSYENRLGYSYQELKQHLESQFKDGMSWENRSEWHIDHIKPIKAFLDEGITDPKIINALDNLQPLWAHENLSKGAKYDG